MLLLELFGLFLLRIATRALSSLLFHDPPRTTFSVRHRAYVGFRSLSPSLSHQVAVDCTRDLRQPPNRRPISATMRATCWYWPGLSQVKSCARRR
jgi:hypothetical protein